MSDAAERVQRYRIQHDTFGLAFLDPWPDGNVVTHDAHAAAVAELTKAKDEAWEAWYAADVAKDAALIALASAREELADLQAQVLDFEAKRQYWEERSDPAP